MDADATLIGMTFSSPPARPPDAPPPTDARQLIDPALVDRRNGKPKRPSKRLRRVIALMLTGKCRTVTAAAKHAGLSDERCYRALREPHVTNFMRAQVAGHLAAGTLRASARLIELVDAKSEHVSGDCARHVLAIDGFKPPEAGTSVNIINNVAPGYVINLAPFPAAPVLEAKAEPRDDK
jgi:hypothetical protein